MTIQEFGKLATKYDSVLSDDFKTITKMIALSDYKPKKFNTRPRQIKLNDDIAVVELDRLKCVECDGDCKCLSIFGFEVLKYQEETIFETNESLHLISFTCAEVRRDDDSQDSDVDVPVKVEIIEFPDWWSNANTTVLMTKNATLQSKSTKIPLPWPVHIKSTHHFRISITQFPRRHVYKSKWLPESVQLPDSKISIDFSDPSDAGLITALEFIKS